MSRHNRASITKQWRPLSPVPIPENSIKRHDEHTECWENSTHSVLVYPHHAHAGLEHPFDGWVTLSIKRIDRKPECDWRIFMRIKNEIVGQDREAFQLFPCLERVVDTANQYFLFVIPKGYVIAAGFLEQEVSDIARASVIGAVQRPFDPSDPLASLVDNSPRSKSSPTFPLPLYPQEMLEAMQKCTGTWQWVPDAPKESSDGNGQ